MERRKQPHKAPAHCLLPADLAVGILFRPALSIKRNASHVCNIRFSSSHAFNNKKKGEINFNNIFYLSQYCTSKMLLFQYVIIQNATLNFKSCSMP